MVLCDAIAVVARIWVNRSAALVTVADMAALRGICVLSEAVSAEDSAEIVAANCMLVVSTGVGVEATQDIAPDKVIEVVISVVAEATEATEADNGMPVVNPPVAVLVQTTDATKAAASPAAAATKSSSNHPATTAVSSNHPAMRSSGSNVPSVAILRHACVDSH